jgi:hypothetical protein
LNVGTLKKKHVGHAVLKLKSFFKLLDQPFPLILDLTHTPPSGAPVLKGQFAASAILTLETSQALQDDKNYKGSVKAPDAKNEKKTDPLLNVTDKSVQLKLILAALETNDLVDTGTSSDPQDPSLRIDIGRLTRETKRYVLSVPSQLFLCCLSSSD